ncbi:MAG: NifB/NifX family molybdenum-iron cluster-binding protein [Candidatus Eremiobacteraeota bacterium]|nr:NifB/NifX family molybdenum-iron cluster-binding protein [Candidatus Eremiobacteraeota bacterium]
MKVAVTSQAQDINGQVDARFGRCQFFIIADPATLEYEAFENPAITASGGAGIQAAQFVAHKGVDAVISGNFGPKAHQTLVAAGVKMYSAHTRTVREALEDYRKGTLPSVSSPTAAEHSGL